MTHGPTLSADNDGRVSRPLDLRIYTRYAAKSVPIGESNHSRCCRHQHYPIPYSR